MSSKELEKLLRQARKERIWIDDRLPKSYWLTMKDLRAIRMGESMKVIEPQTYDRIVTLTANHKHFKPIRGVESKDSLGVFSNIGGGKAGTGTGADPWIKVTQNITSAVKKLLMRT